MDYVEMITRSRRLAGHQEGQVMCVMNRNAYQQMVDEDLTWLLNQPRTLERDHIEQIVRDSVGQFYPANRGFDVDGILTPNERRRRYIEHVIEPGLELVSNAIETAVIEQKVRSDPPASTRNFVDQWHRANPNLGTARDENEDANLVSALVDVAHPCVKCAGPCGCGQVDPLTGLGCRECTDCNRDLAIISRTPVGPDCFGGEDFPSQPSAETQQVIDATVTRHQPVAVDIIGPTLFEHDPSTDVATVDFPHLCVGCQRPACDCGQTRETCKECISCSIPF